MAEKRPGNSPSPERRPVLMSSGSSSTELSTTGSSDLQPFSLGRASSSSNLSSYTVPVRLDVLYFLLNSAARGPQNALPSLPVHGGQVSLSTCHAPAAQQAGTTCYNCCHSTSHEVPGCVSTQQRTGSCQFGPAQGSYSGHGGWNAGGPGRQNGGHRWVHTNQPSDGKSRSGWNRDQSLVGWKENPRGGGQGHGSGNSGPGRQANSGRSWGDRRQDSGDSLSWKSGSQGWRREGSPFGSNTRKSSSQRNQEGSRRQMVWDIPEAKRRSDGAGMGWQKSQGKREPALGKGADAGPAKPAAEDSGENWEVDYENEPAASAPAPGSASHQEDQVGTSKAIKDLRDVCTSSTEPPKLGSLRSPPPPPPPPPPPELAFKDQGSAAAEQEPGGSHTDKTKNSGFVAYLKNLYSDLQGKSSSEGSTDLIIDTDVESSKPSEEEQSPKSGVEAV